MNSKRVLIFDASNIYGGAQCSILTSIKCLSEDCDLTVLTASDNLYNQVKGLQLKSFFIELSQWQKKPSMVLNVIKECRRLRQFLKSNKFDIYLANNLQSALMLSLLGKSPLYFFHRDVRQPDFILKRVVNKSANVFAISEFVRSEILKIVPKSDAKVECLYNGFDYEAIRQKVELSSDIELNENFFNIAVFADFVPWKRIDLAIDAFNTFLDKHDNAFLYIVGKCRDEIAQELKETLANKVSSYGIDSKVVFTDWLANPYALMNKVDVIMSCSESEPFGRTLVEAAVLNKSIIAMEGAASEEILGSYSKSSIVRASIDDIVGALLKYSEQKNDSEEQGTFFTEAFSLSEHGKRLKAIILKDNR